MKYKQSLILFCLMLSIQVQGTPFWSNAQMIDNQCQKTLTKMERLNKTILDYDAQNNQVSIANLFNQLIITSSNTGSWAYLMMNTNPDAKIRDKARSCYNKLRLDPLLFQKVKQIDVTKLDTLAQRFISKISYYFTSEGVLLDKKTREQLIKIKEELTQLEQQYQKNIIADIRYIEFNKDDLKGLPEDFIQAHPADQKGIIKLSTQYPDYFPFIKYAEDEEKRAAFYRLFRQRGYPDNEPVLQQILASRYQKAVILGYKDYADYITQDKMIKSGDNIARFIQSVSSIAYKKAQDDMRQLLLAKKQVNPSAKIVNAWDVSYYINKVKQDKLQFDPMSVRDYFNYEDVQQGVMAVFSEQFNLRFTPLPNEPVWHPSVTAWKLTMDKKDMGVFYLDMHPREGKYQHAAMFPVRAGLNGPYAQTAKASLVCNFPEPKEGQPALMEHGQVSTFFHEFGHLMHYMLSQSSPWVTQAGISNELDFVEAPSQLFEEWAYNLDILQKFAFKFDTRAPLPKALAQKLIESDSIAKGYSVNRQIQFADYSYRLHLADANKINLGQFDKAIWQKHQTLPYVEKTNFYSNFGHLTGYSAIYYTYMWSLSIAKDLFGEFAKKGIEDKAVSLQYRDKILSKGGTKDAHDLLIDFLGRPTNQNHFKAWLTK